MSNATTWAVVDEDFDYEAFYYHIVEYFETPSSPDKVVKVKSLLLWWNR